MQQKLQDEYMKLRLKFYKKVVINASFYIEKIISNRIKSVDRKVALKSLKKFTVKYNLEDYYEELVKTLDNHWKQEGVRIICDSKSKTLESRYTLFFNIQKFETANSESDEIFKINFVRHLLEFFEEDNNYLFLDFDLLRDFIDDISINKKEKANLILEIAKINADRYKSGNYKIPLDRDVLLNSNKPRVLGMFISLLVDFNMIDELENHKSKLARIIYKKAKKINDEYSSFPSTVLNACVDISTSVALDLSDSDVEERLLSGLEALDFLEVYRSLILNQSTSLKQDEAVQTSETVEEVKEEPENSDKKQEFVLSNREAKFLSRSLNKVYDFEKHRCLVNMSMDKIIECVSKMIILKMDEETINKFIFACEKRLKRDPLFAYMESLDKMKSLIRDESGLGYLAELEKTLKYLITLDSESVLYKEGLELASHYVKLINNQIGENYSYEYNKALELINMNK